MRNRRISARLFISGVFTLLCLVYLSSIPAIAGQWLALQQDYLPPQEYTLFDQLFNTHLNYFLSPEAVTYFGFPLTALKVDDRARFGYSNPTEWGYALQAWIAGTERGEITHEDAVSRIDMALTTMVTLQGLDAQNYKGLFNPYYKVTDPEGNDLPLPYQDGDKRIPSGDNALLYMSLLITEGWSRRTGEADLADKAKEVKDKMEFRDFLVTKEGELFLAHQIHADTLELSEATWHVFSDEGSVVVLVAYLSGSVTLNEFHALIMAQDREPATWTSCENDEFLVWEAAKYNSMFPWGIRSLAGLPLGDFEAPDETDVHYIRQSLNPNTSAHLAYGDCLGIDYPAFSDAMTQTSNGQALVGGYTPPNIDGVVPENPPEHIVPHAFFVPLNAGPDLSLENRLRLMLEINDLMNDNAGYYHTEEPNPFGFEVVASPYKDDLSYLGSDDGRPIFETLSHAYITLALFNALQMNDGEPTFWTLASYVPEYQAIMEKVLPYLYPPPRGYLPSVRVHYPPTPTPEGPAEWCDLGDFRFASIGAIPEERDIAINSYCVRAGPNTIHLKSNNPVAANYWLVWDSLSLRTASGEMIWELGENEAPPEYGPPAFDEFDINPPFLSVFYFGQMQTKDFPKEINDLTLREIWIHFELAPEQTGQDLVLFLDTLYASHDLIPYFNMGIRVIGSDFSGP